MEENIKIIETGDGSHTLLNLSMNETYHSRHGALRESQHVFIKNGLQYWLESNTELQQATIFEMGLGTGLNLILSIEQALLFPDITFEYTSLEAYPLVWETLRQLNYVSLIQEKTLKKYFEKIHQSPWEQDTHVLPNFTLKKVSRKLEEFTQSNDSFDLIYYDAFAPKKQPELWTADVMSKISEMMKPGGVFVTYSAKGQLKRDLRALGLKLETLPGPPGKAEMIRAVKPNESPAAVI